MTVMAGENTTGKTMPPTTTAQRNVEAIARMEEAARSERTFGDKVADAVAHFCGSMTFVWLHAIWFTAWIVLNVLPHRRHFDAYPFSFLTLIVSLEAIFLTTFVMVSQNRQQIIADRRNHLDLQINLLSEQENSRMLQLLSAIAKKLEVPCDDDPELRELQQETHPDRILEAIKERIENIENSDNALTTSDEPGERNP